MPGFWDKLNDGLGGAQCIWATDEAGPPDFWGSSLRSFKVLKSSATSDIVGWISTNNADLYWNNAGGNDWYNLIYWAKTENVNTNPANDDEKIGVWFKFYTGGTMLAEQFVEVDQSVSSRGWAEYTATVFVNSEPDSMIAIAVMGRDATGTVWFDNINCRTDPWTMGIFSGNAEDPVGWMHWTSSTEIGFANLVDDIAHSGSYSVLLREQDNNADEMVFFSEPIPVQPGKWYKISGWVRNDSINTGADWYPTNVVQDRDDNRIGFTFFFHRAPLYTGWDITGGDQIFYIDQRSDFSDWTYYAVIAQAPDDAAGVSMRARFTSFPTGYAWYDDFAIEELEDTPNLLPNSDLETIEPAFWSEMNASEGTLEWATDEAGPPWFYGTVSLRSFKISKSSASSEVVGWQSDNNADLYWNNAGGNDWYDLIFWAKTENVNTNPANDDEKIGVWFKFYTSGTMLAEQFVEVDQSVTNMDWTEYTATVFVNSEPNSVIAIAVMGKDATGTVWLDNINCNTDPWTMMVFNGYAEDPVGWMNWTSLTGIGFANLVSDSVHSGSYSVLLREQDNNADEMVFYSEPIPVEPGKWYKISGWVKTDSINTGADWYPTNVVQDRDDNRIGFTFFFHRAPLYTGWDLTGGEQIYYIDQRSDISGWTYYAVIAQAPDDAAGVSMRARFTSFPTGYAWYDDFAIEEVKEVILSAPTATTNTVSNVTTTSATLNGTVNPNDLSTTVIFEYGTTTSYGNTITADQSPVTGTSNVSVSANLTGLSENTTYHYRVVATNSAGTTNGANQTFTTTFLIEGLVAYYPFNGNANDESGNGNNGTVNGATPTTDRFGNSNSAYSFDVSDAIITVPHSESFNFGTGAYALEAWVNASPSTNGGHVLHKRGNTDQGTTGRGWFTLFGSEGRIGFSTYNDPNLTGDQGYAGISSSQSITDGEWHHFTFVNHGDSVYVYIDGLLDNWGSITTPGSPDNYGILEIGTMDGNGGRFIGLIDDIRIYNRALTESEIDSLYHLGGWDPVTFTRIMEGDIVNDGGVSLGASWGDYNNDGNPDLFVTNYSSQNNCLYANTGDGDFIKIMTGDIVNDGGNSVSATWGDYDNDDDIDLFVANAEENNFLYQNNGDDTFTKITDGDIVNDAGNSMSASWGDYDNDGNLDLFVANAGENNFLYKNNGDGTFTKITQGSIANDGGESPGSAWGDYNNDGDLDLFVSNTNDENNFLYENNGDGTFTKITEGNIVNDGGNSLGGVWGDYDNDRDLDLFVTNRADQNNFLYRNDGPGAFTRMTESDVGWIVSGGRNSSGCSWGDYDNDGDLDLFVSNYGGEGSSQDNFLYSNNGDGTFTKIMTGDIVGDSGSSIGNGWCDYDGDGDLDLFVANSMDQNNFLYSNNGNSNSWIIIQCIGTVSNTSAIGAKVHVKATIFGNQLWQMSELSGGTYRSQNSLNAEFGLGDATVIDSIRIEWSSGILQILTNVIVNQFLEIIEASGYGVILHIATWGDDITGDGSESNPYATIQRGIDLANDNDTVLTQPGIYYENINFLGKNITVASNYINSGNWSDVEQTVIDGNQITSVVLFESGENEAAVLDGFTISNGSEQYGGGIQVRNSNPTLQNLIIENNYASQYSGGVHLYNSQSSLLNLEIRNNSSDLNGGGFGAYISQGIFLENVVVHSNFAPDGGGLKIQQSSGEIHGSTIENNQSSNTGGGLLVYENSDLYIYGSQINNNTAGSLGGGLFVDSSNIYLYDGSIGGNNAVSGGGIWFINSTLTINESVFDGNFVDQSGGVIFGKESNLYIDQSEFFNNTAENGYGGVVNLSNLDSAAVYYSAVTNSVFENNIAYNCAGLDFWTLRTDMSGLDINISNCQFRSNSANRNTAILIIGLNSNFLINNCEFSYNEAEYYAAGINAYGNSQGIIQRSLFYFNHVQDTTIDNDGGAISVYSGSDVDIVNCTIVNNTAGTGGGITCGGNSITRLVNTIVWDNHPNQINLSPWNEHTGEIGIEYCVVQDGVDSISADPAFIINWGEGNIDLDPYFIDPDNQNFGLSEESPCIDAGHPDLDGDGETWEYDPDDQDPDGTLMDMGAYYFDQSQTGTQVTVNPSASTFLTNLDPIIIEFSQSVDMQSVQDHCELTAQSYGDFTYYFKSISPQIVQLKPEFCYPLADTIVLFINTGITDTLGNILVIGGDIRVSFFTYLPGDYNFDNIVNYEDFITFRNVWESDGIDDVAYYEMHPYVGQLPNIMVQPDYEFGYDELMILVYMWNWSYLENGRLARTAVEFMGESPAFEQEGSQVMITMPEAAEAGQLIISYQPENAQINKASTDRPNDYLILQAKDAERGELLIEYVNLRNNPNNLIALDTRALKRSNFTLQIEYSFLSVENNIIGQGKHLLDLVAIPDQFALYQNYPNPFNPVTTIEYDLPDEGLVKLSIIDILGRQVVQLTNEYQSAGYKSVLWNGQNNSGKSVSTGVYFYLLESGKYSAVRKLVILK